MHISPHSSKAVLDLMKMRDIYDRYPAAFKRDSKFFVGSMDTPGTGDEE